MCVGDPMWAWDMSEATWARFLHEEGDVPCKYARGDPCDQANWHVMADHFADEIGMVDETE